jgi:putative ABC transport system permease protein
MRSAEMPHDQVIAVTANNIDEDFVKTVGLRLMAGKDISYQDMKDVSDTDRKKRTYHFILNESAAKLLGWKPQQAIGKKMFLDDSRPGYVSGVVRDFHFQSMHDPIKAYVGFTDNDNTEILVKMSGQNLPVTLSHLESKWKELAPDRPFEYRFMEEDYNQLYSAEIRLGKIMNLFSGIAILLACLGLYGLSSYAAQQRFREVGIRKVLGASMRQIVLDLSMDFIKPSLLAIIIAFPLSWWALHKWLEGYVYRIDINWINFLIGGALTILLAAITVSMHALSAARTSPVKSLRAE